MNWRVIGVDRGDNLCEPCDGGKPERIDLFVDGKMPAGMQPKDLVGKVVFIEDLQRYISIGVGVSIIGQDAELALSPMPKRGDRADDEQPA